MQTHKKPIIVHTTGVAEINLPPIMVLIDYYTQNSGSYTIGGITFNTTANATYRQQNTISFIVPDGVTYSFTLSGFPSTGDRWLELR